MGLRRLAYWIVVRWLLDAAGVELVEESTKAAKSSELSSDTKAVTKVTIIRSQNRRVWQKNERRWSEEKIHKTLPQGEALETPYCKGAWQSWRLYPRIGSFLKGSRIFSSLFWWASSPLEFFLAYGDLRSFDRVLWEYSSSHRVIKPTYPLARVCRRLVKIRRNEAGTQRRPCESHTSRRYFIRPKRQARRLRLLRTIRNASFRFSATMSRHFVVVFLSSQSSNSPIFHEPK